MSNAQNANATNEQYVLDSASINRVLSYLVKRPWEEVNSHINSLLTAKPLANTQAAATIDTEAKDVSQAV